MGTHFNKNKNFQRIMHSLDMTSILFLPSTTVIGQPEHTCSPTADWGVWKSGKPESGIGTGIGTGTGTGTGIGTGMGRETYIKAGTTFTLI